MSLELQSMLPDIAGKQDRVIFISASIPDPDRWDGQFNPHEITEAVVAAGRAVLSLGWTLVTAAHPTVAPLLLYVAAEFPVSSGPKVVVYQSRLFADVLPEATRRFQKDGVGDLRWTEAEAGDTTDPQEREASLMKMRSEMFDGTEPDAAIFVGGMQGIVDEHDLFRDRFPGRPRLAVGRPGGAANRLAEAYVGQHRDLLLTGNVYPAIFRTVFEASFGGTF